jgi:hypothetical protein
MLNRRTVRGLILATAVASVSSIVTPSQAQNWATSVSGNWTDGTKWVGAVAPVSGATTALTFGAAGAASYTATNDNAGTFTLNSITGTSTSSGLITLAGNQLSFGGTNPAINQNGSGAIRIDNPVDLSSKLTVGGTGAGTVTLGGLLSSTPIPTTTTGNGLVLDNASARLAWDGGGTLFQLLVNRGTLLFSTGSATLTAGGNSAPSGTPATDTSFAVGNLSGQTGTAIFSGGTFAFANGYAAHVSGSNGYINVTGPSTSLINYFGGVLASTGGRFGTNAGNGTILVNNGAQVTTALLEFGRSQGSNTIVTIDGNGTKVNAQQLSICRGGTVASTGQVDITNRGFLQIASGEAAAGAMLIGNGALTTATLNVNNGNVESAGQFVVGSGSGGKGIVNITNNGGVTVNTTVFIGASTNSFATVNVNSNGNFNMTNGLNFLNVQIGNGVNSTATLNIASGGKVQPDTNFLSGLSAGASSTISVRDSGSQLQVLNILSTQYTAAGTTTFDVSDSGYVKASIGSIGFGSNSFSTINISNNGSIDFTNAFLGPGEATIGGAPFTNVNATNAVATVNISSGGAMTTSGNARLGAGGLSGGTLGGSLGGGKGTVNVLAGGSFSVGGSLFLGLGTLGNGAQGTLNVSGTDAYAKVTGLIVADSLFTGATEGGDATISVSSGGQLDADYAFLGNSIRTTSVTVDGTDSIFRVLDAAGTANFEIASNNGAKATVNVSNGGSLFCQLDDGSPTITLAGVVFIAPEVGALGTLNLSGASSLVAGSQIQIGGAGGTLGGNASYNQSGGTSLSALTRIYGTSTLNYNGGTYITGALTVDGRLNMSAGNNKTLEIATLTVNSGGLIDMGDNGMIVDYPTGSLSPASTVRDYIVQGRNAGAWSGTTGITSSAAAANPGKFGVGYAEVGTGSTMLNITSFRGINVDTDTVVVRETYNGDADLNGDVDSIDFNRFLAGYGTIDGSGVWANGDFDYDGKVTTTDFNFISGNFGEAPLASPVAGPGLEAEILPYRLAEARGLLGLPKLAESDVLTSADLSNVAASPQQEPQVGVGLGSAVPEPGTLGLLTLAGAGLSIRRRRESK